MSDSGGKGQELSDDATTLMLLVVVGIGTGIISLAGTYRGLVAYLVDHHVLVPAKQALVRLPGDVGGLDGNRLAIIVVVLLTGSFIALGRRPKR